MLLSCLGEGERGSRERGKQGKILRRVTLVFYVFKDQCLRQRFQT